jgi:ubiquilin
MMQNPQMMQQMMQMMGGNGGAGGAGETGFNPFAAMGGFGGQGQQQQAPVDNTPPEERYAAQLRQLNDMGFYEFERNVQALRRSGGSVQGAIEYLFSG